MARKPTSEHHCPGCGLDTRVSTQPLAQVRIGHVDDDGRFKSSKVWGKMHESCFLIAIGDPQGVVKMAQVAP